MAVPSDRMIAAESDARPAPAPTWSDQDDGDSAAVYQEPDVPIENDAESSGSTSSTIDVVDVEEPEQSTGSTEAEKIEEPPVPEEPEPEPEHDSASAGADQRSSDPTPSPTTSPPTLPPPPTTSPTPAPGLPYGDINVVILTDVHSWVSGHNPTPPPQYSNYHSLSCCVPNNRLFGRGTPS